ncbi:MAG: hypothetical protein BA863_09980 [Desulfovibrio sp. S3730MH75]|nr:MAG: hypothetical protein BA863_09980 [Desulfovibrio sp. S3730MH75]
MRRILIVFAVCVFSCGIVGCTAGLKNLDTAWEKDNTEIANKLGSKFYSGITKEQAMSAMVVALQRLDVVVESADFKIGLLMGVAQAPKPLTFDEFETVIAVEDARAKSHSILFSWSHIRDFKSVLNFVFLEASDGIQISIRGRLESDTGSDFISITQFPPKALEVAYPKIWDEFEKIAFVQDKTLK